MLRNKKIRGFTMNWIQVQTFVDGPHTYVGVEVFLPQRPAAGKKYPLLMLLHGRGTDRTQWLKSVRLERYAEEAGIALALIQGNQSFYVDSAAGYLWGQYVTQELPEKLALWFPISDRSQDRLIMGVDMGGYGAMMAVQNAPEAFAGAVAVAPVLDVEPLYDTDYEPRPEFIFGERKKLSENGYALSNQCQKPVRIYCGVQEERQVRDWALGGANLTVCALEGRTMEDQMEEAFRNVMEGGVGL